MSSFSNTQASFAAYIRNPTHNPLPAGVDARRMAMYRELFFNNINSFLSSNFPVLHSILNTEQWQNLTQKFFAEHPCRTPYFSEIADEFISFLQNQENSLDFPFVVELAHYEWVEMALAISMATPKVGDKLFVDDILNNTICLSPLAWPLAYQYPVQKLCPDFLPSQPPEQATYLIVYRDIEDKVHFMQTTLLTFRLLQVLEENPGINSDACLCLLVNEALQLDNTMLMKYGFEILQDMAIKGIVIPANDA